MSSTAPPESESSPPAEWPKIIDDFLLPYKDQMSEEIRLKGRHSITVKWPEFTDDMKKQLDEKPRQLMVDLDNGLRGAYHSVDPEWEKKPGIMEKLRVRISDFPRILTLRDLDSDLLGKYIEITGIIVRSGSVQPLVTKAFFKCKSCGAESLIDQYGDALSWPTADCHDLPMDGGAHCIADSWEIIMSRGKFENCQRMVIQENPEDQQDNPTPIKMNIRMPAHLINLIKAGDRVYLYGILEAVMEKRKSRICTITLDVNNVEIIGEDIINPVITPDDLARIEKVKAEPGLRDMIVQSIAPSIYGYEDIKMGLALMLFGGTPKETEDGVKIRGDINEILIGDPGTSKSVMLKYIQSLAPRGIYAAGGGASGVGLTAAAIKPEGSDHFELEAGALVLANGGIACIDEFDKMNPHDRAHIHEPLAQQTISINKGGINATLQAKCSILAAANPRDGRYDRNKPIRDNITFPPTLLSRFDLIWVIKDAPDKAKDSEMTWHILRTHSGATKLTPPLDLQFLKKYIAVARKLRVVLGDEAQRKIHSYYTMMRNQSSEKSDLPMSITARQLETAERLTEAMAKMRMREIATGEDAELAVALLDKSLNQIGYDPALGMIDIAILDGYDGKSKTGKVEAILQCISNMTRDDSGFALEKDIINELVTHGAPKRDVERVLDSLDGSPVAIKKIRGDEVWWQRLPE